MLRNKLPAYLTTVLGKKCCSACGKIFERNTVRSMGAAFAEHVKHAHRVEQPQEQQLQA